MLRNPEERATFTLSPEAYKVVKDLAQRTERSCEEVIGDAIAWESFILELKEKVGGY